jgi:hypothetical protein
MLKEDLDKKKMLNLNPKVPSILIIPPLLKKSPLKKTYNPPNSNNKNNKNNQNNLKTPINKIKNSQIIRKIKMIKIIQIIKIIKMTPKILQILLIEKSSKYFYFLIKKNKLYIIYLIQ